VLDTNVNKKRWENSMNSPFTIETEQQSCAKSAA
jgi:hypothetical protein